MFETTSKAISQAKFKATWLKAPLQQRYLTYLIIAVLGWLACGRFLHLAADFPIGVASAGVTYTDEGWWSRNAVAWLRTGDWYIDDGYNPIVNLPVVPLLQLFWFKIFGIGLVSARALAAVCFLAITIFLYAIARHKLSSSLALLTPLIALSSYPTFVFSRLALLEMPMILLVLISLWLATTYRRRISHSAAEFDLASSNFNSHLHSFTLIGSALFLAAAILAKPTALFALPMIATFVYLQTGTHTQKIRRTLVWLLWLGLPFGAYYLTFVRANIVDYEYFNNFNVSTKMHKNLFSIFEGPLRVAKYGLQVFPLMLPTLLVAIFVLYKAKEYRSNYLFQITVLWTFLVLGTLSASNYAAPRYFLVLIVPISLGIPLAIQHFLSRPVKGKTLFLSAVSLSVLLSLGQISAYMLSPQYSFVQMAQQVEGAIASDPAHSKVLMGHFADSLALTTDIQAINDQMGAQSLPHRIETFNPGYYISIGAAKAPIERILTQYYQLELLNKFDVYQNHDYGEPVFFYKLMPL
jgi:4-amino-4-deoxy-L-arabinose transferase-like glycosyltransferase